MLSNIVNIFVSDSLKNELKLLHICLYNKLGLILFIKKEKKFNLYLYFVI